MQERRQPRTLAHRPACQPNRKSSRLPPLLRQPARSTQPSPYRTMQERRQPRTLAAAPCRRGGSREPFARAGGV